MELGAATRSAGKTNLTAATPALLRSTGVSKAQSYSYEFPLSYATF